MPKINKGPYRLYNEDCFDVFPKIADRSVDMVMCDPPYGTTACKWDSIIPLEPMWEALKWVIKPKKAILIMGQEIFSSSVRLSNPQWFKYDWYWQKSRPAGFVNAKLMPLKEIEVVSVFSCGTTANGSARNMPYFPQGVQDCSVSWERPRRYTSGDSGTNPSRESHARKRTLTKTGYPRQVLAIPNSNQGQVHPTQKPVALMEYLIKTYTNEGETVLDFAMGSGTTGVACGNLERRFIGCDNDKEHGYFEIAERRIREAYAEDKQS